tara:strand:- start:8876 stop:9100 length:225 start_codon:yes stop_codon:yes gene_type:complete
MPTNKIRTLLFLILVLILFIDPVNAQCSMCRAVLESEEGQQTAKGINNGIIYLMAIPYILVALVGWKIFKIYKN